MDRLVVVKFHKNITNRWLFMIQIEISVVILLIDNGEVVLCQSQKKAFWMVRAMICCSK